MCNPPNLDMVAQAVLLWAGSCRQQLLHAGATVQNNAYVKCFRTAPLGKESRPHPYLRAGLRIPHSLGLSMAGTRGTWQASRSGLVCAWLQAMCSFGNARSPPTLFVPSYRCG
jgi:hypothetical protein